jgi:hypothetical protein
LAIAAALPPIPLRLAASMCLRLFVAFTTGAAAALPPRPGVRAPGAERHHGRRDDVAHEEKLKERRGCRCRLGTVVGVEDEEKRSLAMLVYV